jgi:hypothetical protein
VCGGCHDVLQNHTFYLTFTFKINYIFNNCGFLLFRGVVNGKFGLQEGVHYDKFICKQKINCLSTLRKTLDLLFD